MLRLPPGEEQSERSEKLLLQANGQRQTVRTCRDCSKSHWKWLPACSARSRCIDAWNVHVVLSLVSETERKSPLPHLVSWAQLVNGKDLSRVQSLAENIYGSQLATKHPVSVGRLGGTQETLVIALQGKMKKKTKKRGFKINLLSRNGEGKKNQNTLIGCKQRPGKGPSTFWVIADVLVQLGPQHEF